MTQDSPTVAELLGRLDERVQAIYQSQTRLERNQENLEKKLTANYVTQREFAPVRLVVWGLSVTLTVAIIGSVLAQVLVQ